MTLVLALKFLGLKSGIDGPAVLIEQPVDVASKALDAIFRTELSPIDLALVVENKIRNPLDYLLSDDLITLDYASDMLDMSIFGHSFHQS